MDIDSDKLEKNLKIFAHEIFKAIGEQQPSSFNKNALAGKLMSWSMSKPDFKVNLFRLVDVLPSLDNSKDVVKHINEYLAHSASKINWLAGLLIKSSKTPLTSSLTKLIVKRSVKEMAKMFIAGETPQASLKNLHRIYNEGMTHTVDLLGEYSVSEKEAIIYFERYSEALDVIGQDFLAKENKPLIAGHPGCRTPSCVSVKLSALYSQCSALNIDRSVDVLSNRLSELVKKSIISKTQIYVDAEDTGHNEIIYETFKRVFSSKEYKSLHYPGIVVQAYTRSAEERILDLLDFARKRSAPIAIRLVKGAYWDHETAIANQNNWDNPLFIVKEHSDANYEKLSNLLLDNHNLCLPAFASHNLRSLCYACVSAKERGLSNRDFELQMLYGMADPFARAFRDRGYLVRFYVPVGEMLPGMGYLVRRLLENTSNESFLRHTFADSQDLDRLLKKPTFGELSHE
jgi:RHH-type proline utilization regulon transcriptional repressor/proline dehydrogenase/delta 1-pyrroline-5-carboxylate dehydrogenase